MIRILLKSLIFYFSLTTILFSQMISQIEITGNKRISEATIKVLGEIDTMDIQTQYGKNYNHRHLWCINPSRATNTIKSLNNKKFEIISEYNVFSFSLKFYKRIIQKILILFLSNNVMMSSKVIILKKINI